MRQCSGTKIKPNTTTLQHENIILVLNIFNDNKEICVQCQLSKGENFKSSNYVKTNTKPIKKGTNFPF